jgi:hypothetical protein
MPNQVSRMVEERVLSFSIAQDASGSGTRPNVFRADRRPAA